MIMIFGSIHVIYSYRFSRLVKPGNTGIARSMERFLGGKGLNQALAAQRLGAETHLIGSIAHDDIAVAQKLAEFNLARLSIGKTKFQTGHAIISVDDNGEYMSFVWPGANHHLSFERICEALDAGNPEQDWVLLQNETNLIEEIVYEAHERGYRIAYSAAPFVSKQTLPLLDHLDLLMINAINAAALRDAINIDDYRDMPVKALLITRGVEGADFYQNGQYFTCKSMCVDAVDTYGAGDTFCGVFLGAYVQNIPIQRALTLATVAAGLQVTRPGAAEAIPMLFEIEDILQQQLSASNSVV